MAKLVEVIFKYNSSEIGLSFIGERNANIERSSSVKLR